MSETKSAPPGYRFAADGSLRCEAGAQIEPTKCDWHPRHYWCDYCLGHYGVPHEESMHKGPGQHPLGSSDVRSCACRFCIEEAARLDMQIELVGLREKALDFEAMKAAAVAAFWDYEYLTEARNLVRMANGVERLSNSMSDLSSWVIPEIEELRGEDG